MAKLQGFCKIEVEYLCNLKAYLGLHGAKRVKLDNYWSKKNMREEKEDGIGARMPKKKKKKGDLEKEGRERESPTWGLRWKGESGDA